MNEEQIFLQAVEIDAPDKRSEFLDVACGGDNQLRASVESLLKHHSADSQFLECPPIDFQQTLAACQSETLNVHSSVRTLDLLTPSANPGGLGELGPYEVLEVIGRGGMGVVLRARDVKLNRVVAIKLMNEWLATSPEGAKRFLREAQAAAAVRHDHVVTIHSIQDDGPVPYLVLEYVEGGSLEQRIAGGKPLPVDEIVRIGSQIAAGLEAAHQRGLVHRDIKPANILLEAGTQRVKITDFGLARALNADQLTQDGQLAGTPEYMSPEQARGGKADSRSDLFSLGSVLYRLCTGRPAFPAESAIAALRAICDDQPSPIRALNPQVPEWLERIVNRLMEKEPDLRPQGAGEVAKLLSAGQAAEAPPTLAAPLRSPQNRQTVAAWIGAVAVACAAITLVVNRNGKSTRVEVPDGANVRVTPEGNVEVDLPSTRQTVGSPATSAGLPPQVRQVVAQLVEINPGFDGQVDATMEGGGVVGLRLQVDQIKDISPLKSLANLQRLSCEGSMPEMGQLADLEPLRGSQLRILNLNNTHVEDLSPLAGMPLEQLSVANTRVGDLRPLSGLPLKIVQLQGTAVTNLAPLRGSPLVDLNISHTRVTDLSPLWGMKLVALYCDVTQIADLSPLASMPLKNLNWRGYDQTDPRHQQVVRSITTLEMIDSLPAAEFWKQLDAKRRE